MFVLCVFGVLGWCFACFWQNWCLLATGFMLVYGVLRVFMVCVFCVILGVLSFPRVHVCVPCVHKSRGHLRWLHCLYMEVP